MKIILIALFGLLSFVTNAEVISVSQQTLLEWQAKSTQPLLLDVRSKEEFQQGHIQGAVNIPYDELPKRLNEILAYKNKDVVVYCRSGRRAGIAEQFLDSQAFTGLHHLDGDILLWQKNQLPLVKQ